MQVKTKKKDRGIQIKAESPLFYAEKTKETVITVNWVDIENKERKPAKAIEKEPQIVYNIENIENFNKYAFFLCFCVYPHLIAFVFCSVGADLFRKLKKIGKI